MKKIILLQILFMAVLGIFGYIYFRTLETPKLAVMSISSKAPLAMKDTVDATYPLINPYVEVDNDKHYILNFKDLRKKLIDIEDAQKHKTFIYFAYLNNSSWIGLKEKDLFKAASTVKVPLAMSFYRLQEQGKIKLTDSYFLTDLDLDSRFGDLYKVGADKSFTIEELIGIMLQHSDDTAMHALLHVANLVGIQDPLKEVYMAMGWEYADVSSTTVSYIDINLKTLSNMFISLYNATYLSVEDSSKVLGYLSNTDFKDKIVAGIPSNIVVSHKIGVLAPDKTYSDCGIVYVPNRSYLLCLGSSGVTEKEAIPFFVDTSKAIYEYITNN
jgi:beta-lactamase class A